MNQVLRWLTGLVLLPGAVLGVTAVVVSGWAGRLPERIPNKGGGGRPVLSTLATEPLITVGLTVITGLWLLGVVVFFLARLLPAPAVHWARTVTQLVVAVLVTALCGALLLVLASALDARSPEEVRTPSALFTVGLPVAVLVVGAFAFALAGRRSSGLPVAGVPPADAVRFPLAKGERVLWSEHRVLRPLVWAAAGQALIGVVMAVVFGLSLGAGYAPVGLVVALTAAMTLAVSRYRLVVDEHAVRVATGPFRREFPLTTVEHATSSPLDAGDWLAAGVLYGYGTVMTPAPGSAVRLVFADGSRFTVGCEDADTLAALINSLRHRQHTA
ncbi:hypothetical protein ALI22I_23875 [Saccharothrix sp. ALI-22-I]|uniref:hypothetical protein n=1 Tax=Saccharothrix sp. ALI-22-I TaxID=1933778 RepID=UPI00097C4E40|nr:hypothetical protein [Saccharothrix sp. ALI-22-I]ONI86672.1 hypothetical protein ALI22I_23875 [Saccharothrix sp. ALI-22-I]